MIMKADSISDVKDWQAYIETLTGSGKFRGGSALGNGIRARKAAPDEADDQADDNRDGCIVAGFMRFEADSMAEVSALLPGNPAYEAGGEIEILELTED